MAIKSEILPRNRFNKITIPGGQEETENFLTAAELKLFLTAAKERENITNYTMILLLSYTGLRKGEALGLTWNDVDLVKKTISVERTRDKRGTRAPKTKNSYRTILIDDTLMHRLKIYRTWCKQTLLSFGKHLSEDEYVFISYQSGTPMGENTLKYCFDRITKKEELKPLTPHGLRHYGEQNKMVSESIFFSI